MPTVDRDQEKRRDWLLAPLGLILPAFLILFLIPGTRTTIFGIASAGVQDVPMAGWQLGMVMLVGLICWFTGTFTLAKGDKQLGSRLLFLLTQALGLALGTGVMIGGGWPRSAALRVLFSGSGFLSVALYLHYRLTEPKYLGKQPRWWLSLLYVPVVPGIFAAVLNPGSIVIRLFMITTFLIVLAGMLTGWVVYFRFATPPQRQHLRVGSIGLNLVLLLILFGHLLPRVTGWYGIIFPLWVAIALLGLAPAGWFIPWAFKNLYLLDRILNKVLLGLILTLIILMVILGYFVWLLPRFPESQVIRGLVTAGLVLGIGLVFHPLQRVTQQGVDRLFYKGSYQDPLLLEKASQTLAGSLSRRELNQALTREIPGWMRLSGAQLWFGEASYAPTRQGEAGCLDFELKFQAKVRAIWTLFPHQDGRPFSARECNLLQTIADQAEVALRNVLLVETLRRRLDEIRAAQELLGQAQHQLIRSRENERSRLARDLHDGPIQSLVALNLALGLLDPNHQDRGKRIERALVEIRAEMKDLIGELREVCAELRPPLLDTLGLGLALEALVEDWGEENEISVTAGVEVKGEILCQLPDEAAVNLYRIVQEALHNIEKHARAKHVTVKMSCDTEQILLEIIDDGAGFAVPDTFRDLTQGGHFGLVGMRERVNLIGGQWGLASTPGKGTRVTVTLPVSSVE